MTATNNPTRVRSLDGTEIAYWTSGNGPPLVMVHGVTADHSRWTPLLSLLEPHATICAMDRRGRGASGDQPDYLLAREFEDVAAVVSDVAQRAGQAVDLYGHSFGGLCAFGAAALSSQVRRLVLYEGWPSVDPRAHDLRPDLEEQLDALLAQGDRDAVVELIFRELGGLNDEQIATYRALPAWGARIAAAHTVTREIHACREGAFDARQATKIRAPTLLVRGSESSDPAVADLDTIAAALPDAETVVLEGQGHVADVLAPELFSKPVLEFLRR
jgi:pimeloyl-ACP methyl ester carboxylesterase